MSNSKFLGLNYFSHFFNKENFNKIHSVPSYKERSYKERLVEMLQSKEQRLVEILALKEHCPLFNCKEFCA